MSKAIIHVDGQPEEFNTSIMITYSTIKEAFENGTGDVFYTKNKKEFIALNRHSVNHDEMIIAGFDLLSYNEVLEFAVRQDVEENKKAYFPKPKEQTKQFINYPDNEVWGYYDEFPDALNQSL